MGIAGPPTGRVIRRDVGKIGIGAKLYRKWDKSVAKALAEGIKQEITENGDGGFFGKLISLGTGACSCEYCEVFEENGTQLA